ncbi:AMED_5909 family protein [Actinosynnema sp. NPDC053489]|uniref:AMED_5909 family protein n=1 Tax=Actinosynnema sp. NPDC053489 TaxID=3363916 RepID=UPI0037CA0C05
MAQPKKLDRWAVAMSATTLKEAHEVLGGLVPSPDAAPSRWRGFYLRSAQVYARVAEVDRGHHHEALYWAKRERERSEAIAETPDSSVAEDDGAAS